MGNWKKILGWCILSPIIAIVSYVWIMTIVANPISLIGIAAVGVFVLGIYLVTGD